MQSGNAYSKPYYSGQRGRGKGAAGNGSPAVDVPKQHRYSTRRAPDASLSPPSPELDQLDIGLRAASALFGRPSQWQRTGRRSHAPAAAARQSRGSLHVFDFSFFFFPSTVSILTNLIVFLAFFF